MQRDLILHGLYSTRWLLLCLAAVGGAGVVIALLLRYERRLVPRGVGYALLGLRLAVLGVLLLTLLEPVVVWSLDRRHTGRVVVAVDLSESMGSADPQASSAEKLRWARALGMIGNETIDERLDRWAKAFEAGEEPPWVDENEAGDARRRAELARARKENLEGIFKEIDRLTRKEIALRLLTGTTSPLLPQLEEFGTVEVTVFAGASAGADAATLETTVGQPPESVAAEVSNLAAGLSAGEGDTASPLVGVVLLSDGRDNAGRDVIGAATRLAALSAPVYPVLLGSELRPKDLAIASLDYPPTVFKDDKPLLRATLNTSGFEGEAIEVVLEREGGEPVTKTVRAGGATANVEFELESAELGRHEHTVRTEVRTGETNEDNNQKSFALRVIDDKVRVLLVEGEARWEFRFIDNALSRDERADVRRVVFRQPFIGALDGPVFPGELRFPAEGEPPESSPLAETDVVIVGDVDPEELPDGAWLQLEKFVAESGGTLVLVAGKRSLPLAYQSAVVDRLVPLTGLRPIDLSGDDGRGSPAERGFHLQLTPEGERLPMLQFDADPVENLNAWGALAGHTWGLFGTAKPGATVLAYAMQPGQEDALAAEREGAVIVQQPYGFGQVLWLGIDSTWRWRHRVGDAYHHRFWGQVARWGADNKAAVGNEFVRFGPERGEVEEGEDVVLRARWSQPFAGKFPQLKGTAELFRVGEPAGAAPFSTVELKPADGRPLVHEARVGSLPPGEYRVRLTAEGADLGEEEIATSLYVSERQTLELSDVSANRALMTQIAEASSGRLLFPDEIGQLAELLQPRDYHTVTRREVTLWNHWTVMVVFFGLMMAEWVVRKVNGLP